MGKRITDLPELTTPTSGDWFEIVDASDISESAEGTSKRVDYDNISIADASTTVKGKVELATDAETIEGTDTVLSVTPSNLTAKIDTDGTLAGNSDTRIPSQKAVKTYGDRALNTTLNIHPLYAQQGFLINGKISVTDAAGITVAIKTLAGNDPSETDPVFVRIGDTVHMLTAALSVSKADGTNWMNAGSAELATKEIDYFVYLGYNATDGVTIGFSSYPGANSYDDFSATTTNEKYCAISTITNAAATDYYEVVGRFAATLSAGAGYTWSVPTYTAKNLIQRPIYETRWLTVGITANVSTGMDNGSGGQPTIVEARYKITGNKYEYHFNLSGTKATTTDSIAINAAGLFPIVNNSNDSCVGATFCYAGAIFIGAVQYYGSYYTASFETTIADNTVIRGLGMSGSYEI